MSSSGRYTAKGTGRRPYAHTGRLVRKSDKGPPSPPPRGHIYIHARRAIRALAHTHTALQHPSAFKLPTTSYNPAGSGKRRRRKQQIKATTHRRCHLTVEKARSSPWRVCSAVCKRVSLSPNHLLPFSTSKNILSYIHGVFSYSNEPPVVVQGTVGFHSISAPSPRPAFAQPPTFDTNS